MFYVIVFFTCWLTVFLIHSCQPHYAEISFMALAFVTLLALMNTYAKLNGFSYDTLFIAAIVLLYILTSVLLTNFHSPPVYNFLLMALIVYWVGSIAEWSAHKFIMHCDNPDTDPSGKNIIARYMIDTCKSHITHHLQVNADMSLSVPHDEAKGLYFNMASFLPALVILLIIVLLIRYMFNIQVSIFVTMLLSVLAILAHNFLWNWVHPNMHYDAIPKDNVFLQNHTLHHVIKGDKKANFNIIFFGADEVMTQ